MWRPGDPVKHLGPPYDMVGRGSPAFYRSQLFSTRCGLGPQDGYWRRQGDWDDGGPFGGGGLWADDDDYWCVPCVQQAGLGYELWDDEQEVKDREPGC